LHSEDGRSLVLEKPVHFVELNADVSRSRFKDSGFRVNQFDYQISGYRLSKLSDYQMDGMWSGADRQISSALNRYESKRKR
jgi:hypothetical protein